MYTMITLFAGHTTYSLNTLSVMMISKKSIRIEKYRQTRFWAVWLNWELLAVVCYKKGALAIRETLLGLSQNRE